MQKQLFISILFFYSFAISSFAKDKHDAKFYIEKSMEFEFTDPMISLLYCDSALSVSKPNSNDQARSFAMLGMLNEDNSEIKEAIKFYKKAYNIYLKNKNYKDCASSLVGIGTCYKQIGDFKSAILYYKKALNLCKKHNHPRELSIAYDNLGIIYSTQGDFKAGLELFLKSREINERSKDTFGLISSYNYIANSFQDMNETDSSKTYLFKSLRLAEKIGDSISIGDAFNNVAFLIKNDGKIREAISYYKKSISIRERLNDFAFLTESYDNLGLAYLDLEMYDSAFYFQGKALNLAIEFGNQEQEAHLRISIGEYYLRLKKWNEAILFLKRGYELAKEISLVKDLSNASLRLSIAFAEAGDYKNAYLFHKDFKKFSDSLYNEGRTKEMTRLSMQYNYDKQERIRKLEQEREDDRKKSELEYQQMIRNVFIIVSVFLLVIAGIIFYNFRQGKIKNAIISRQKKEVEHQKEMVDEKNKEILDSITYAKRLQEAILPPMKVVKEYLEKSFILYKPKDIVAGDFYFTENLEGKIVFAAADCTGHGVPGAMVSVVCANALNRAVKEFKLSEAGKILDKVRELVVETFSRSESEVKDGMDISLCVLDLKSKKIHWSGANNPLWIIRENEIIEYKPDKQPIGKYTENKSFNNHEIDLHKNDLLYVFTDGYEDQFGGEKGKKFKTSKMKELFLSIQSLEMEKQKEILNETFENWRGKLEQVDDVCIIGVKI